MAAASGQSGAISVLIIESDAAQQRTLAAHVDSHPTRRFAARVCADAGEARRLAASQAAIVIGDLEALGGVPRFRELAAAVPVIATSTQGSLQNAVAAMRAGAVDFVAKPIGARALLDRLEQALEATQPRDRRAGPPAAAETPPSELDFAGFVGRSPVMRAIYEQIGRIAPSRAPVFITGESGTGKEVCAEAIHAGSQQHDRPFVALNCAAIPRELIESELFGHVRGAFTGAIDNRTGAAELADGGTLFLDEIGELDLSVQAKLLRFVQTGLVQRVGGEQPRRVDVRIISATNRDPTAAIAAGRFREDLFYRLHVLPVALPPLRARGDDILRLARHFLRNFAAEEGRGFVDFAPEAGAAIQAADWPGNVRQLQNTIRRSVVLNDGDLITAEMLPADLRGPGSPVAGDAALAAAEPGLKPFWMEERRIIETAIAASDGNIARAAAALGLSPSTIYRKRQAWSERTSA